MLDRSTFLMRAVLGCALGLGAVGCAHDGAISTRRISPDAPMCEKVDVINLRRGTTTKQDVLGYLGWPSRTSRDAEVFLYSWDEQRDLFGPVPVHQTLAGTDDYQTRFLMIEFDSSERVSAYTVKNNRAHDNPLDDEIMERHPGQLISP